MEAKDPTRNVLYRLRMQKILTQLDLCEKTVRKAGDKELKIWQASYSLLETESRPVRRSDYDNLYRWIGNNLLHDLTEADWNELKEYLESRSQAERPGKKKKELAEVA